MKYVFVTGGVVSGLGKCVTASALGSLLKARGLRVIMQKFDPYLNLDHGRMDPGQHGEVFVTEDGAETDLDLGHYERFLGDYVTRESNITSGQIYNSVIERERQGGYCGGTIQIIPHITDEIQSRIYQGPGDVTIVEVDGVVGDIENQAFLEAIRQFQHAQGRENAIQLHVTLVPYIRATGELKTKPAQSSVKSLLSCGLYPDIIVARSDHALVANVRDKIAQFCNVPSSQVLTNLDVQHLYEVPMSLERENLAGTVCRLLNIQCPPPDLSSWIAISQSLNASTKDVKIALVAKAVERRDAYISVIQALDHAGIAACVNVSVHWVDADQLSQKTVGNFLGDVHGLIVPGGYDVHDVDGIVSAIEFARRNSIPFLGISLGLQAAVIEFARNLLGMPNANSTEFAPETEDPVVCAMENWSKKTGSAVRLGAHPITLEAGSRAHELYGASEISERFRGRYGINNQYRKALLDAGMRLSGTSEDGESVEMVEISAHPFFVATQAHPEFRSGPGRANPLFKGFVEVAYSFVK
jgi:CTP synthase